MKQQLILITLVLTILLGYTYYSHIQTPLCNQQQYQYYLHKDNLKPILNSSFITLPHPSNISEQLISFLITTQQGQTKVISANYSSDSIQALLHELHPSQISHIILKSPVQLSINSRNRLLQGITTDDTFINFCINGLVVIFSLSRNLILVGIFTNTIDLLMPIILFFQSFIMLAFWTNSKHLLTKFYQTIFSSKLDIFNLIRLIINNSPDQEALPILSIYNYSSDIFFNVSGQLIVSLILVVITIIIKIINVFSKVQSFRQLQSNIRPLWNAYIFAITPRITMFVGFQTRNISSLRFIDFVNALIATLLFTGLVFFLVQLIIQIRKINSRVEYLQESRLEIGLVKRIDYKRDFNFDCLRYSMLHYTSMIYIRLIVFFFPIGAAYDIHYVQYSGCFVSLLFIIMIGISCPGYIRTRDKVIYIICDFLFLIVCLCLIAVGLAQSVYHSQASLIAEKIMFSLLILIIFLYVLMIMCDVVQNNCIDKSKQKNKQKKQQQAKFIRDIRNNQQLKQNYENSDKKSQQSEKEEQKPSQIAIKKTIKIKQQNIKKIRNGKII